MHSYALRVGPTEDCQAATIWSVPVGRTEASFGAAGRSVTHPLLLTQIRSFCRTVSGAPTLVAD